VLPVLQPFYRPTRISNVFQANLHFKGEIMTDARLRERGCGTFEGKTWKEFNAHPEYDGWRGTFTPEGGETWYGIQQS
jgi:broad specificity phosphatase PhoE